MGGAGADDRFACGLRLARSGRPAEWRYLARLYARYDRCAADRLAHALRRAQTPLPKQYRHASRLAVGAHLPWHGADSSSAAAHRFPIRLERAHIGFRADADRDLLRLLRRLRLSALPEFDDA